MHNKEVENKHQKNGQQHLHFGRYWHTCCDTAIAEVKIWTVHGKNLNNLWFIMGIYIIIKVKYYTPTQNYKNDYNYQACKH